MPYGIDAGTITGNAELAQSIELGFGFGRKRPPAITRADRQRVDRFDDHNFVPVQVHEESSRSSLFGQSWTEAKILEIGPRLGSHLIDRLHRAAPEELTQPTN